MSGKRLNKPKNDRTPQGASSLRHFKFRFIEQLYAAYK